MHLASLVPLFALALRLPPPPTPHQDVSLTSPSAAAFSRRHALSLGAAAAAATTLAPPAYAAVIERVDDQFAYRVSFPTDWADAPKPVRTHLHELLLSSPTGYKGGKLGITVDPVKINSLEEFGNLDEVTKRVLTVEEGRDGVTSVTLRSNAAEAADAAAGKPSYYAIEWATVSSRGTKVYCCKYCIAQKKLYVLQAQANLDAYDNDEGVRSALTSIVSSFQVSS